MTIRRRLNSRNTDRGVRAAVICRCARAVPLSDGLRRQSRTSGLREARTYSTFARAASIYERDGIFAAKARAVRCRGRPRKITV